MELSEARFRAVLRAWGVRPNAQGISIGRDNQVVHVPDTAGSSNLRLLLTRIGQTHGFDLSLIDDADD